MSRTPRTDLALGMGVAAGRAAGRLVVDRGHHTHAPRAVGGPVDPGATRDVEPDVRLLPGMAQEAGLGVLVHDLGITRVGRVGDPPLLVEDPDAFDPRFATDGFQRLVRVRTPVGEHGMPGRARDAAGELVGATHHAVEELAFLRTNMDVREHDLDHGHQERERKDEPRCQVLGKDPHAATIRIGREDGIRHGSARPDPTGS